MLHKISSLTYRIFNPAILFFFIVFLTAAAHGQSAVDGFDPNANGEVNTVVVQPDGKIIIGGDFTTVSPNGGAAVTRNRIARFNPDGTLDAAFDPNANNTVFSIAVQLDGKVLAGGLFTTIGGLTRNRIARLDATTGAADSFDPNANGAVFSIAVQSDGKILAGGLFTNIGGQPRNRIARLDAATGLADSFNPNASSFVLSIAVQSDGKVLAGGNFITIGGQTRNFIARLDAATGLADSFNPNANGNVNSIAAQSDGKILAGGVFTTIGGQPRNRIARLDASSGLPDSFDPNSSSTVNSIAVQSDGKILAGGFFATIGGQPRSRIARLDAASGLADSFNPNASNTVNTIAVQQDGKILAAGGFTTVSPNGGAAVTRNRIARFERDGLLDQSLNNVRAIAVQSDGNVLVGGSFLTIGGATRNFIARLDGTTGLADSFGASATNAVYTMLVQNDGKILVGGLFTFLRGQSRNFLGRLNANGTLDMAFNPNPNNAVFTIAVQSDGRVLAGGSFFTMGGLPRSRIARLDAATGVADSFNPNAENGTVGVVVNSIAVQSDGRVLAGGNFTTINGVSRGRLARLDATTGLADSFNAGTLASSSEVFAIAVQPDGKLLVGGSFFSMGGQARNHFARVSNDTAALSTLAVTTTTLTLTRDGSAPQFARVIFEQSTDNGMTYTLLGSGTPSRPEPRSAISIFASLRNYFVPASESADLRSGDSPEHFAPLTAGYTLTGLSLPTGQNILIRARGYYRSGYFTGSESIEDKVQIAYFTPPATPTPTNTPTATPTNTPTATPTNTPTATPTNTPTNTPTDTPTGTATDTPTDTPTSTPTPAETPSISGTITYGNAIGNPVPPRFVKNVSLSSTVGSPSVGPVITGTPGTYSLTGFGAGSYTIKPTKPGGANTSITSNDAARVAQGVSGALPFVSNNQRYAADVSGNGGVSSQDAAKIAQFVAGLPFSPPNLTGEWRFFTSNLPAFPAGAHPQERNYASVTSSATGEDYVGILIGEVSGNWNPATHPRPGTVDSGKLIVDSENVGPERGVEVKLPQMSVSADKEIVVPVNVEGAADKGIISYEFDLRYDPSVIQPVVNAVDVKGTVSRGLSVVVNPYESGLLRVVVYGPMPIDKDGVLLNLKFTAVGSLGSVSPLTFERIMFNEGEPQTFTTGGLIVISE